MDKDVNTKNKELYNQHASKYVSQDEAMRQRDQGMAAPLKYFHNLIKTRLIQRFAGDADKLLDLACGRGGDLYKWIRSGIKYVRGYDIAEREMGEAKARILAAMKDNPHLSNTFSADFIANGDIGDLVREGEIEEAKARLAAAMKDSPELSNTFSADFIANGDIGDRVWEDEAGPYGAVTCMFALHYFFRSEESAMKAIAMAAKNLKRHGYFFGVLPDGKNVLNAIGESMKPKQFKAVRMAPRWVGVPQPFGSAYTCALTDTVTEGGNDGEGSFEYLVYQRVLVALAAKFDLHPVTEYEDFQLDDLLDPPTASSDGSCLFRRFHPNFEGSHPSLELASKLNCAFVFRKGPLDGAEAPVATAAARKRKRGAGVLNEGDTATEDTIKRSRMDAGEGEAAQRNSLEVVPVDTAARSGGGVASVQAVGNAHVPDAPAEGCLRGDRGADGGAEEDQRRGAVGGHGSGGAPGGASEREGGVTAMHADVATAARGKGLLDSADVAREAAAREQEKMKHVAAQYAVPQYKRSSKFKRTQ